LADFSGHRTTTHAKVRRVGQTRHGPTVVICLCIWAVVFRLEILKGRRTEYVGGIASAVGKQLEFESGQEFSEKLLFYMTRFTEFFFVDQIFSALRRQLLWTHFL
jgi:hypothetical protein